MQKIPVVIGLGFGDEGKGTTVDFLCSERDIEYVIRFSGGPQTAHNVVMPDGRQHTFSQFGSGSFRNAQTILSEYVLVNPFNMILEADALWGKIGYDPMDSIFIAENALLITPIHVAANRQREINRGGNAHGSCGLGIGETRAYAIYHTPEDPIIVNDMRYPKELKEKLILLKKTLEADIDNFTFDDSIDDIVEGYKMLMYERRFRIFTEDWLNGIIKDNADKIVFEGSQGVLLDESFGFHPHTTWSNVTAANAVSLASRAGLSRDALEIIGITRTYTTRHGYGPFPSEFDKDFDWTVAYPEKHNTWGRFQGNWRVGTLDVSLLEYAVKVLGGIDSISLTHADITVPDAIIGWEEEIEPVKEKDLDYQERLTNVLNNVSRPKKVEMGDAEDIISLLEDTLSAPVSIVSYGPTAENKKRR